MFNALLNGAQYRFQDWLYGPWDEDKLIKFQMLYSVPGVRQYMDYWLDQRDTKQYLDRYGLDYSDIRDPRKLKSTSSAANYYSMGYRMISRNIDRLYR